MNIIQYSRINYEINHKEYIDTVKLCENTRILSLNPNSINLQNDIRANMLVKSLEEYQIDIAIFNETNINWNKKP